MNWGACYLDHFTRFFGAPVDRQVFLQDEAEPSIQILAHDGVFQGCRVFTSLGLSHYVETVGEVAEIVVPVDDAWESVPGIIANTLFYVVQQQMRIGWGMAIAGVGRVNKSFANRYGKEALYLAKLYDLPEGATDVRCDGNGGSLYAGLFISDAEYRFFLEKGAQALETVMQDGQVDPYHLTRASIV